MFHSDVLEDRAGVLFIDGVSVTSLADQYDTPLYVLSERRIRSNYRRVMSAFSKRYEKTRVYYSAKANTNLAVLRILKEEGAHVDTVSPGEVYLALRAGFSPERILFTGTSVRNDELEYVTRSEVSINVDSVSELNRLLSMSTPQLLSFRINPEIGAGHHEHVITAGRECKFGLWETEVLDAYRRAMQAGVSKFGMQMHIGSGILDPSIYRIAAERLLDIAGKVARELGIVFELIDFGGGLGIPYRPQEHAPELEVFAENLVAVFMEKTAEHGLGQAYLCIEPGRYLVGDAGVLLTRVNTVKTWPHRKFIGVDAGFNTLVRPTMYGSYHHIVLANRLNAPEVEKCDVAGPICETGDLLAKDRMLPKISEGDLLAVLDTGAYGYSMSSQYNSRPRCAEILVNKGEHSVIRKRESIEDLLKGQRAHE